MPRKDDTESRSASMEPSGVLLEETNEVLESDRRKTYGQKFKYIFFVYLVALSLVSVLCIFPLLNV